MTTANEDAIRLTIECLKNEQGLTDFLSEALARGVLRDAIRVAAIIKLNGVFNSKHNTWQNHYQSSFRCDPFAQLQVIKFFFGQFSSAEEVIPRLISLGLDANRYEDAVKLITRIEQDILRQMRINNPNFEINASDNSADIQEQLVLSMIKTMPKRIFHRCSTDGKYICSTVIGEPQTYLIGFGSVCSHKAISGRKEPDFVLAFPVTVRSKPQLTRDYDPQIDSYKADSGRMFGIDYDPDWDRPTRISSSVNLLTMCTAITPAQIKEALPAQITKKDENYYYKTDTQCTVHSFKNFFGPACLGLETHGLEPTDSRAQLALAKWLCTTPSQDNQLVRMPHVEEVIDHNVRVINEAYQLRQRDQRPETFCEYDETRRTAWIAEKLQKLGISNHTQITPEIAKQLILPELDEQKKAEILRDYPDSITFSETDFPLQYNENGPPLVTLCPENETASYTYLAPLYPAMAKGGLELPSGTRITQALVLDTIYRANPEELDSQEALEKARKHWLARITKAAIKPALSLPPANSGAEFPKGKRFGLNVDDPATGKELQCYAWATHHDDDKDWLYKFPNDNFSQILVENGTCYVADLLIAAEEYRSDWRHYLCQQGVDADKAWKLSQDCTDKDLFEFHDQAAQPSAETLEKLAERFGSGNKSLRGRKYHKDPEQDDSDANR